MCEDEAKAFRAEALAFRAAVEECGSHEKSRLFCMALSGHWQSSYVAGSSLWLFCDNRTERAHIDADFAVITAATHLQSRIEKE